MTPILVGRVVATSSGSAVTGHVRGGQDSLRGLKWLMTGFVVLVWLPLTIDATVVEFATQPGIVFLPLWGLACLLLWRRSFRAQAEQQDALAGEMVGRLTATVEGRLADADLSLASAGRP